MHTGIENEILATLQVIAAQNNELIGLIRGYLDENKEKKKEEGKVFKETMSILYEEGLIGAVGDKLASIVKEYKNKKTDQATCSG